MPSYRTATTMKSSAKLMAASALGQLIRLRAPRRGTTSLCSRALCPSLA